MSPYVTFSTEVNIFVDTEKYGLYKQFVLQSR